MIAKTDHLYWYAIYTRPRWEKKIAKFFENQGIENFCPLKKVVSQWHDRKKVIMEPAFKSYVFVKIREDKKWEVKKIRGVLNYVYWLGQPAKIREEEIITMKKFFKEFIDIQIEPQHLFVNTKVKIREGILMNYEGMILEILGNKAIVKIDSLNMQLSAHFDKKNLETI